MEPAQTIEVELARKEEKEHKLETRIGLRTLPGFQLGQGCFHSFDFVSHKDSQHFSVFVLKRRMAREPSTVLFTCTCVFSFISTLVFYFDFSPTLICLGKHHG